LVEAARRTYADAPEPHPIRARRRLIGRGVATALAAAVAIAVAVVAVVALGHRHTPSGRTASSPVPTRAALRDSATQTLRQLVLPPGAVASGLVPGTPAEFDWQKLSIANHVDIRRVWRLPERPGRVIDFIVAHRPRGSSVGIGMSNSSGGPGGQVTTQVATVIGIPLTSNGIWRELALTAISVRGGGTRLRIDSEAGWLAPRPASERIPPGTTRVVLTWTAPNPYRHRSLVITRRTQFSALLARFNSLPPALPGTGLCRHAADGFFRFSFVGEKGVSLADAVWAPPCRNLGLRIGRGPIMPVMAGPPTMPAGAEMDELLTRLLYAAGIRGSGSSTVHSAERCSNSASATPKASTNPAKSRLEPGVGVGSCASGSSSTTSASSP
jgi:hypothetical protein